jgi:hypothetical protein
MKTHRSGHHRSVSLIARAACLDKKCSYDSSEDAETVDGEDKGKFRSDHGVQQTTDGHILDT